jgi:hypothetical protein
MLGKRVSLPFVSLGSGPGAIIISENGESMNDLRWRESNVLFVDCIFLLYGLRLSLPARLNRGFNK